MLIYTTMKGYCIGCEKNTKLEILKNPIDTERVWGLCGSCLNQ